MNRAGWQFVLGDIFVCRDDVVSVASLELIQLRVAARELYLVERWLVVRWDCPNVAPKEAAHLVGSPS